jgi:adhesin/invasin
VKTVPLLSAYDAKSLFLLYDSGMVTGRDTLGTITHFATPTVANGKVYAGTQTQLVTYGLFSQINGTAGSGQTGNAGSTLPIPLTVVASNPYTGAPIPGVTVTFSDGGKKGTFSSPTAVTDSNGQASTSYTLPNTPQTLTISATSAGYAPASFTETDVVGPVASLTTVSGGKQTGTVGTTLPLPLVVKAKDAVGNVVPGASVNFSDGFGGTFSPNPAVTASNGQASATYTLPIVAKALTVTASVGTVSVKISETATAGPATAVNMIQGNNQSAHVNNRLPKNLIVSVTDQYGNGIAGLTVNFSDNGAGGSFSNANPVTGTTGQVSVSYTTPPQTGVVTITASYSTLTPVTFTETVD